MKIIFWLSLFCIGYSYFGCKKSKATPPPQSRVTNDTAGSDTALYYSFHLDSISYSESAYASGYWTYGGGSNVDVFSSILPKSGLYEDDCCGYFFPWDTTGFFEFIGGINNNPDSGATISTFYNQLNAGKRFNYGSSARSGIVLTWVDRSGDLWSTALGSADQTGSSFLITESVMELSITTLIISASYNCKLYDSAGNRRTLINGKSRLPFDSRLTQ